MEVERNDFAVENKGNRSLHKRLLTIHESNLVQCSHSPVKFQLEYRKNYDASLFIRWMIVARFSQFVLVDEPYSTTVYMPVRSESEHPCILLK